VLVECRCQLINRNKAVKGQRCRYTCELLHSVAQRCAFTFLHKVLLEIFASRSSETVHLPLLPYYLHLPKY